MRILATLLLLFLAAFVTACPEECKPLPYIPPSDARFASFTAEPDTLFGRPPEDSLVSEGCCMPSCVYHDDNDQPEIWTAPVYLDEDLQALRHDWVLAEPWPVFEGNDFNPPPDLDDSWREGVCAVRPRVDEWDGSAPVPYDLVHYDTENEAEADGAMPTHSGQCGACSSLANLAVYIAMPNLTEPIRQCGFTGLADRDASRLACIASLGFDLPCAQAWDINTKNTQEACLTVCGKPKDRKKPGNVLYECKTIGQVPPDIDLVNECLACDEEYSLELFRRAAGRSRRASGLPSPICRRCDDVFPVEHYYPLPKR